MARHGRVLLPGVLIPVIGLLGGAGGFVAGLVAVLHPGAPNHSLGARWGGGEIITAMAWGLYKLGSQRFVLDDDEMRIVTWGLCWRVPRGFVRDVELRMGEDLSLVITLADGYRIRPTTFLGGQGIGSGIPNFMGRARIRDRILEWNAGVPVPAAPQVQLSVAGNGGRARRYWRVRRDDLPVLAGVGLAVAIEAIVATRLGIW